MEKLNAKKQNSVPVSPAFTVASALLKRGHSHDYVARMMIEGHVPPKRTPMGSVPD